MPSGKTQENRKGSQRAGGKDIRLKRRNHFYPLAQNRGVQLQLSDSFAQKGCLPRVCFDKSDVQLWLKLFC